MENTPIYGSGMTTGTGMDDSTNQTGNQMHNMTNQAKDAAGNLINQARTQVKTQLSSQKDRAAEGLTSVADAIRQTGTQLNGQEQAVPVGQYAERAAEVVDNVAEYLRTKEIDDMVGQVEDYARNRPAVFIGTAFALGFMAARFLRTSASSSEGSSRRRMSDRDRFSADYYRERETIREAELHERQGYPVKSAYERAAERGVGMGSTGMGASGLGASGLETTPTTYGSYGSGTDLNTGTVNTLGSDMDDDDVTTTDYAQSSQLRTNDV